MASVVSPLPLVHASTSIKALTASPTKVNLVLDENYHTSVWAYNGQVPGPILRYRQGDTLRLLLENHLTEPTTIHWHGLRVPVSMDGVPHISQEPVEPGNSFLYEFPLEDAGTFWYHPHLASSKQIGMGLYGALIVDEENPPQVDRDLIWVIDDWRLNEEAQIASFDTQSMHDHSHDGRLGNVVTVNGTIGNEFPVRSGERLRLRLINVANARIFTLKFNDLEPWIISWDGQPVQPYLAKDSIVSVSSGERVDLIIDMVGQPGSTSSVIDFEYGAEFAYYFMNLKYDSTESLQPQFNVPEPINPNPIALPDLANAELHQFVFQGGAGGRLQRAKVNGEYSDFIDIARSTGRFWAVNDRVVVDAHSEPPLIRLDLGKSYIFDLVNDTVRDHPIHLHGHIFQVISINGESISNPYLRDTLLLRARDRAQIAFVADNPGKWMFHCHVLEHQESGMTGIIDVV